MRALPLFLLLAGCTAVEEKGDCIDWEYYTDTVEKCIPLYGQLICAEQEVTRYVCTLRMEDTSANHGQISRSSASDTT